MRISRWSVLETRTTPLNMAIRTIAINIDIRISPASIAFSYYEKKDWATMYSSSKGQRCVARCSS